MISRLKNAPWGAGLLIVAVGGLRAQEAVRWRAYQHEHVLGTSLELKFAGTSAQAEAAERAALAEIDRLDGILSGYRAASEFRRWLDTWGEVRRVSPELVEVLALFDTWRDRTGGALDPAAEVAGRLWRAAAGAGRVPDAGELAAAVATARGPHWRLDVAAGTATRLTRAPLILNSLAKGYVIERACEAALAAGVETAVVNLGGDLVVRGAARDLVRIADPVAAAETDEPLAEVAVGDRAVATSGGYRRGVEIDGQWYSHLVDPRTAQPAGRVASATVVAPRATDAGALATALGVLPPEEGLRLVATIPEAECLLVLGNGERRASAGWTNLEQVAAPPGATRGVHAARSGASGGTAAGPGGDFELAVNLELAAIAGGRARRPFVAVWIEDKDGFPVRTLALWYNGARWLPDLRSWYHADQLRQMAEGGAPAASVSSATRPAGRYTLRWDARDSRGQVVAPGRYTVAIEVAREHGTHQLVRQDIDLAAEGRHVDLPSNLELAALSLDTRRTAAGR